MSAPVGAAGAIVTCSGANPELPGEPPPAPPRGRASLTASFTRSHLLFDGEDDATFDRWSLVAASDLYAGRFTVTLAAGALLAGTLEAPEGTHQIAPGWLGALGLSWRVLEDEGALPYVVLSASLGAAGTPTRLADRRGDYVGLDFRFGATAGKTFFGWLSPYVTLRAFGGPIFFFVDDDASDDTRVRLGTDKYHFQAGLGAVFILPENLDLFVEGQPGAEQGAFAGLGWRY